MLDDVSVDRGSGSGGDADVTPLLWVGVGVSLGKAGVGKSETGTDGSFVGGAAATLSTSTPPR